MEKETAKIADKQSCDCRHLEQKTTDHIDEELRLEIFKTEVFLTISVSFYVRILEQGSKIHGEKSQSQLCWSISDFLRALLVSFDFDFSDPLSGRALLVLAPGAQRLDNAIHQINSYPADKC